MLHQGGFAGAILPNQRQALSGGEVQRHLAQRLNPRRISKGKGLAADIYGFVASGQSMVVSHSSIVFRNPSFVVLHPSAFILALLNPTTACSSVTGRGRMPGQRPIWRA